MQVTDKNREARSVAVCAVACAVLQLALAPNLALGNGHPNFALVFSATVALLFGGRAGVLWGFAAGLFFDLTTTGPVGLMAFCLTVSSYVLGIEVRNRIAGNPAGAVALFSAASLAVSLVYHLAMLLVGEAGSVLDALVFRMLPTTLLTIVCFVPFALLYARTGAGGPSLGRSGSHLSTRRL